MVTEERSTSTGSGQGVEATEIGEALAAILAAGIGSLALGIIVVLNETGVYSAPTLYGPSGGVTGRVAIGLVVWLVAWAILHALLRKRRGGHTFVYPLSILLIILGILATFPPLWGLLGG